MAIIQNNLADAFVYITDLHRHLGINEQKSQLRLLACLDFVKYLNCKSKYSEKTKLISNSLIIEENEILESLSEFTLSDKGVEIISKSVGMIQKLLLEVFPPETDEYKYLIEFIPNLKNFLPE